MIVCSYVLESISSSTNPTLASTLLTMPRGSSKAAKVVGYNDKDLANLLNSHREHPVKGEWRKNRTLDEIEVYICEVVWTAKILLFLKSVNTYMFVSYVF